MGPKAPTLQLRHLSKRYASSLAVDDVSFTAQAGEITGYLGPNGSGKSTTIKMIAGLIEMTAGEILFDGIPVHDDLMAWKQRVGYVPEEPHLYGHLSALEYLVMVGQLRDLPATATAGRIEELLHLLALQPHETRHIPLSAFSKGMRQKVLLVAALLHDPEVILLDEPFSGLDVGAGLVLRSLVQELARRGKVVLFSSHDLEIVERVCRASSSCTAAESSQMTRSRSSGCCWPSRRSKASSRTWRWSRTRVHSRGESRRSSPAHSHEWAPAVPRPLSRLPLSPR